MKKNICDVSGKEAEDGSDDDDIRTYTFEIADDFGNIEPEIQLDISNEHIDEIKEGFEDCVRDYIAGHVRRLKEAENEQK